MATTLHLTDLQEEHNAADLVVILRSALSELQGVSSGNNLTGIIDNYSRWAENTERAVGNVLNRITTAGWVYDDMYWRIRESHNSQVAQQPTMDMVRHDCERRRIRSSPGAWCSKVRSPVILVRP